MAYPLAQALDIPDPLGNDDEDFQSPRVSRLTLDKEAEIEMLIAIGDATIGPAGRARCSRRRRPAR